MRSTCTALDPVQSRPIPARGWGVRRGERAIVWHHDHMKEVEYFNWMLPPDAWKKKPHPSTWKMTREDAAARGLTEPVLSSREVRMKGETPEEEAELQRRNMTDSWLKAPKGGEPV